MTTISNTENELYIKQTLTNLQRIFHQHLIKCDLHLYNTKDKMMNLLRKESGTMECKFYIRFSQK